MRSQNRPFRFSFSSSLKVHFQGSESPPTLGLLVVRELDERLGLGELISDNLTDAPSWQEHATAFVQYVRQSVYSRLAGYEDLNDAERLPGPNLPLHWLRESGIRRCPSFTVALV